MSDNTVRARLRDTNTEPLDDDVVVPASRRRFPELLLGLLLVIGGALAGVVVFQSSNDRLVVVGAARDLSRGSVLTRSDVVAVEVGALPKGAATLASDAGDLLGMKLLVDLPAGVPISPHVVTNQQLLGATEALIPIAVDHRAIPSGLGRGDLVRVIISFPNQGIDAPSPEVLAETVEVFDIDVPDDFGDVIRVTVRANADMAVDIARANRVQLMKVSGS
jgi:hypothetical protein